MTGGTVRRASPAMVATYHEYLIEDYHRTRAVADGSLVLVRLTGEHAGRRVEHPRCPADHPRNPDNRFPSPRDRPNRGADSNLSPWALQARYSRNDNCHLHVGHRVNAPDQQGSSANCLGQAVKSTKPIG